MFSSTGSCTTQHLMRFSGFVFGFVSCRDPVWDFPSQILKADWLAITRQAF